MTINLIPNQNKQDGLFTKWHSFVPIVLLTAMFVVSGPLLAHTDTAYNRDETTGQELVEWMTPLDGSLRVSQLSIPGTHDTAAYGAGGEAVITQSMTIGTQLRAGIRAFDLRVGYGYVAPCLDAFLYMFHGPICQGIKFRDVVDEMESFLTAHPNETIIVRLKRDHEIGSWSFDYIIDSLGSLYYDGSETNPTLDEIRGKIFVLTQSLGGSIGPGSWGAANQIIQDKYNLANNFELAVKWRNHVSPHFRKADALRADSTLAPAWEAGKTYAKQSVVSHNGDVWVTKAGAAAGLVPGVASAWIRNEDAIYVNHLSAAVGGFPYFFASGHSSWETSAPRLWTSKLRGWAAVEDFTDCDDFDWCIDEFPSLNCVDFLGIEGSQTCSVFFEGINILSRNYLSNRVRDRAGIVMIDFPGASLIKAIVDLNPYKIPLVAAIGGLACGPQAPGELPPVFNEGSDIPLYPDLQGSQGAGPLTFRWDTNGDDVWDTPFLDWNDPSPIVSLEDEGILTVRMELKDRFGDTDIDDCVIEFRNGGPFLVSLQGTTSIDEGQTASVNGLIGDTGLDVQIVEIDWDGDGESDARRVLPLSSDPCPSAGYCTPFFQEFLFEDNPGGTNTAYTRRITITDEDGFGSTHESTIHVRNVPPSITSHQLYNLTEGEVITANSWIPSGTEVLLDFTFTDPGFDTFTAAVRWDNSTPPLLDLDANEMQIQVEHTFTFEGPRQVVFSVYDDDFGQTTGYSVPFNVGEPPPPPLDPPVAITTGPYSTTEGRFINADASGSTVDASRTPQFRWDFDGDGSWDTERSFDPVSPSWFGPDELNPDDYSGTLRVEVWDGSTAAVGETTVTFTNLDPLPFGNLADNQVSENEMITLTVDIDDPGDDTFTVHVDWDNDGSNDETVDLPPGSSKVELTHTYPDDPEDDDFYLIGVTAVDEDGGMGFDQPNVYVYNVAPTLNIAAIIDPEFRLIGVDTEARQGVPVRLFATWSDPGPEDTHEVLIDWGDGSTTEISDPDELIDQSHVYTTLGPHQVTVTITDDDEGEDSDSWPVIDVIDLMFKDGFDQK